MTSVIRHFSNSVAALPVPAVVQLAEAFADVAAIALEDAVGFVFGELSAAEFGDEIFKNLHGAF